MRDEPLPFAHSFVGSSPFGSFVLHTKQSSNANGMLSPHPTVCHKGFMSHRHSAVTWAGGLPPPPLANLSGGAGP